MTKGGSLQEFRGAREPSAHHAVLAIAAYDIAFMCCSAWILRTFGVRAAEQLHAGDGGRVGSCEGRAGRAPAAPDGER